MSIPRALLERGAVAASEEPRLLAEDARLARDLGATWVRANSPVYPYLDQMSLEQAGWDWTRADRYFTATQQASLDVVVVLGPWPGNRTAAFTDAYLPEDLDAYAEYVRRVVERYDGDGTADMPGLARPVKVWEVDNEPDLHNSAPPRGAGPQVALQQVDPSSFETPDEYAQVLLVTARAVREADPGALVLSGGIFHPHHETGRAYLARVLEQEGVLDTIDGVSLHCYVDTADPAPVARALAAAAELAPTKPAWITETGAPSAGPRARLDETGQVHALVGIVGTALARGATRLFWHTLADPPDAVGHLDRAPMSTHSLMRTLGSGGPLHATRVLKPAGKAWRRLVDLLGALDFEEIEAGSAAGAAWLVTPRGWLVYAGRVAPPPAASAVEDLLTGEVGPPGTDVRAPAWISLGE